MKIAEMKINEYLDILKSEAPAPGGGSVSALSAAQGVGLVSMVAELTIGRPKYAEYEALCKEVEEEAWQLHEKLVTYIDKDTEAFSMVSKAYKMPKESEAEKAARSKAIADATLVATQVPFDTLQLCAEGLRLTEKLVGKSNPNASSDLGVAALNLLAGIKGAWLNIKINLPNVKDEGEKAKFMEGKKIIVEAESLAAKIYAQVAASL